MPGLHTSWPSGRFLPGVREAESVTPHPNSTRSSGNCDFLDVRRKLQKLKHNEEVGVPVPRVVYDTLQAVEQNLDPQHLNIVFSDFHRKQYPKLELTYEAFKEVFSMIPCVQDGIGQDALEGSIGPLSLEQDLSSDDKQSDTSGGEESPKASTSAQKRKIVRRLESFSGSSGDEAPQMADAMDEDSDYVGNKSKCATDNKEREMLSELGNESVPVSCFSKGVLRGQEARTGHSQASSMTGKAAHGLGGGRSPINSKPKRKKRGPRIPKDKNMNFDVPELPVTCGEVKGTLYKEKFKTGTSSKCILREDGEAWLTLREFEIEGGRGSWKNWRISVRCGGWRLKDLIEKNLLPDPPRSRRRPENYNVCVVCCRSGTLFCCDSCPKSFHKRCHIQRINAKSNPWFCIFCRIKKIQKNTSQNQSYQESEVLVRPMDHINGLSREHEQDESWSLCLNTIKDKLCRNKYLHVGAFVRDMRLIVENYKTFYENQNIVTLGFQLEKDFEDNFKAMFSIQ
nr:unnamed protein product [Sorex araneus]